VTLGDGAGRGSGRRHLTLAAPYLVVLGILCLSELLVRQAADAKDLVAASSTPLVLAILVEGENYGYAILRRVRELSDGHLQWTDGMLYPLLHRLQRLGYVTTEWRVPPEGRRRRYYAITDEGRAALAEQQRQWLTVARALGDVWQGKDPLALLLDGA
jgi:PadR family transcriptional regulator, regulatory protein PadR